MSWLIEHWVDLLATVTSAITMASVIAKMTPSSHDDEFIDGLLKFVQWLSINGTPKQ